MITMLILCSTLLGIAAGCSQHQVDHPTTLEPVSPELPEATGQIWEKISRQAEKNARRDTIFVDAGPSSYAGRLLFGSDPRKPLPREKSGYEMWKRAKGYK